MTVRETTIALAREFKRFSKQVTKERALEAQAKLKAFENVGEYDKPTFYFDIDNRQRSTMLNANIIEKLS